MVSGPLTPAPQVPQARASYAPGGMRDCPHRWLDVPWWEGCDGTPAGCERCWKELRRVKD